MLHIGTMTRKGHGEKLLSEFPSDSTWTYAKYREFVANWARLVCKIPARLTCVEAEEFRGRLDEGCELAVSLSKLSQI